MAVREKEVEAIQAQAKALAQEDQSAGEVERTSRAVEEKFRALCQPMRDRCRRLQASREQHQFHRDVEDETVSYSCPGRAALGLLGSGQLPQEVAMPQDNHGCSARSLPSGTQLKPWVAPLTSPLTFSFSLAVGDRAASHGQLSGAWQGLAQRPASHEEKPGEAEGKSENKILKVLHTQTFVFSLFVW